MRKAGLFFGAMLYGTSWTVALINLLASAVALSEGRSLVDYLPMILLPLGIVLYIHHLAGWFPFQHRA